VERRSAYPESLCPWMVRFSTVLASRRGRAASIGSARAVFNATHIVTSSRWSDARCLVPQCGGRTIDATTKETLWDRYFTGAPRPLTPSEQQYSDRRLRSRRWGSAPASTQN